MSTVTVPTTDHTGSLPMTATDTAPPRPRVGQSLPPAKPVPFLRTARVEFRKLLNTLAGRWLVAITILIALAIQAIFLFVERDATNSAQGLFEIAALPFSVLLPVIGIMAATAEWSQRAGLVTFTLEPRRWRVIAARVVAVTVLGILVVAATLIGAYAVAGIADLVGISMTYSFDAGYLAGLLVVLLLTVLQGLAFGFLFLNTPAAIVTILALPMVWQIGMGLSERVANVAPWLELTQASMPLTAVSEMTGQHWAHLATAVSVGILLPLAIGSWRVIRGEVK